MKVTRAMGLRTQATRPRMGVDQPPYGCVVVRPGFLGSRFGPVSNEGRALVVGTNSFMSVMGIQATREAREAREARRTDGNRNSTDRFDRGNQVTSQVQMRSPPSVHRVDGSVAHHLFSSELSLSQASSSLSLPFLAFERVSCISRRCAGPMLVETRVSGLAVIPRGSPLTR